MAQAAPETDPDACVMERLREAPDGTTVGELRATCAARQSALTATVPAPVPVGPVSAVSARREAERGATDQPFLLTVHQPN